MRTSNVVQFALRAPKAVRKPYVGPIEAERERCIAVFLSLHSQGPWADMAKTLVRETDHDAEYIVAFIQQACAAARAEMAAEIAAGTF
jgi:hypothetical protein